MTYKGYTAIFETDEEDGVLHGRVADIQDVVTFESETQEGLEREFQISVDVYLDLCAELGQEPDRPGKPHRRTSPEALGQGFPPRSSRWAHDPSRIDVVNPIAQ